LPPDPALVYAPALIAQLERANQALGRLNGITLMLPDPALFPYQYVRKEALLSSQIEGTQSSLSDLLLYELAERGVGPPTMSRRSPTMLRRWRMA
jgi:Fic family protein